MASVGVRALKQNASAVVARAAAGETLTITDRGRPVAQITPLPIRGLADRVAQGLVRPPRRSLRDLGPPLPPRDGATLTELLEQDREERL